MLNAGILEFFSCEILMLWRKKKVNYVKFYTNMIIVIKKLKTIFFVIPIPYFSQNIVNSCEIIGV